MATEIKTPAENLWLAEQANEIARIGYWELNLTTHELFWSKLTKIIHELDVNQEPSLDKAIGFYKEGESQEAIKHAVNLAMEKGEAYDLEVQIITATGKEKWVRTIGNPHFEEGKCTKLFGTFQDIELQKQTELALKKEKQSNEQILIGSGLGTWEWNVQTGTIIINKKWAELIGYSIEELSPITIEVWRKFAHPIDFKESNIRLLKYFKGVTPFYEMEIRMKHKNGNWIWVYDRGMLVSKTIDGKPLMMFGIHQDITQRKNAETELFGILSLVKSQNVKFKNYSHIVNHNLRSHAGNIYRLLDLALDADSEEEKEELLTYTKTASKNLMDTIGNLAKITNVNEDITAQLEIIPLHQTVQKAIENVYGLASNSKVVIENRTPLKVSVNAVPAYADSIILNLLTNAIKYSSPKRKAFVLVEALDEKDFIVLLVKDNGLGINLQKHGEKLFGMYQTFHDVKDSRGIGLFLTKTQIEAMSGLIEVESVVDVGSTFKVYFKK